MAHALKQRESDVKIGSPAEASRVVSVDVLRGVVMFLMLFVNDVASVQAAPAWMKHVHPGSADGMTFVDVVFPAFLFIVGMSIPLALRNRIARGDAAWKLTLHALARAGTLLILGVFMVNMDRSHRGWRDGLWPALVYLAAIAACVRIPRFSLGVRVAGAVALAVLARVYDPGKGEWFETSWWGILGLIGWAYLVGFLVYLVVRDRPAALVGAVALLYAMFIAGRNGLFDDIVVNDWVSMGEALGSHAAITVSGVLLIVIVQRAGTTARQRITTALLYGGALALGAILLRRPWGINKIAATPAWCLWSSAITCWVWVVFHWLNDVQGWTRGWGLLRDLGRNALLAYLLHPLFYAVMDVIGTGFWWKLGDSAAGGVSRSLALAAVIGVITALLYRRGVRIRI
jgi:heparan-alpha-glucosaminide N-acetyltransferase